MSQKWNLQDIRPAEKRRRRPEPRENKQPDLSEPTNPNSSSLNLSRKNNNYNNHNNHNDHNSHNHDYDKNINENRDEDLSTVVINNKEKKRKFNIITISAVVGILILAVLVLSAILSKTTLTVYPEFKEPNVNAEFIAYPDRRDGLLAYEIMTLEETGEAQVKATGEEHVETQAKGTIEIIKTTTGSERLIKNTRFRSPDGLVFRIQESVVVPGAIKDENGNLVPGTIRAEVFADDVGQEYNLSSGTRFDVPGFKESNLNELYNAIYAENRENFTGGFNGPKFIIDEGELSTAQQALQMELRDKLLARIESEKPAGFVTFLDSVAFTFVDLPTIQYGEDLVTIRQQAILFKESEFAGFIAKETITTYGGDLVKITNVNDLQFTYTDSNTSATNLANLTSLNFSLVGKPLIVWEYDVDKLKEDLAGKPKTAITTVLTGQSGIATASVSGKPFWKRSFPSDPEDIEVIEIIGDEDKDK